MEFPSDGDDAFLVRSLIAAWTMDAASARPSRSWEEIELYRHPGDVPRANVNANMTMEPALMEGEESVLRRTTCMRNPPVLSADGDYLMHAHTGEWVKITKMAKGFHVPPGTRLAELVDRKEFLCGQAVRWRMSALLSGDIQLSRDIVFVSPPNFC